MTQTYRSRLVLPVVHHLDGSTSIAQAELAFKAGADGVFLISHNGRNSELEAPARVLRERYPDRKIGINLLGQSALHALSVAVELDLNMVWADAPGVTSAGWTFEGKDLINSLQQEGMPLFFGSVAFKYQPKEMHPALAAQKCMQGGLLPTTSGEATGKAPDVQKARTMSEAVNGGSLAVASGMTPENVAQYLPYFTHYLVATGVSLDMHHFDEARLRSFTQQVHQFSFAPATAVA